MLGISYSELFVLLGLGSLILGEYWASSDRKGVNIAPLNGAISTRRPKGSAPGGQVCWPSDRPSSCIPCGSSKQIHQVFTRSPTGQGEMPRVAVTTAKLHHTSGVSSTELHSQY